MSTIIFVEFQGFGKNNKIKVIIKFYFANVCISCISTGLMDFEIMSNPIKSPDIIVGDNLLDMNDNCEKSIIAGKACIDDNVIGWSIVQFESDDEDNVESFLDLIPSSWIMGMGSLCWYPIEEHKATIQKLMKQCAKADLQWNCFSIKKIHEGIGKFPMS